jgi:hypothetical protein
MYFGAQNTTTTAIFNISGAVNVTCPQVMVQ